MEKSYLDMSLLKNQNCIAVKLSHFFTVEELEQIDFTGVDIAKSKRNLSKTTTIAYEKEFKESHTSIALIDTLLIDVYPVSRYLDLRIIKDNNFQMDFRCQYSKKINSYLNIIISKAINFSKYRNKQDIVFIKGHILDNFAAAITKVLTLNGLKEIRFVSEYINSDNSIFAEKDYKFEFIVEENTFCISANQDLIKFMFSSGTESDYIYFIKNKIGIASISLIIEKAIKAKQKEEPGRS